MEKLYRPTPKKFSKWLVGGCIFLILLPRHKLQKPSKESGIFQSLGTINFVLFLLKGVVKRGGGMAQWPPKYAFVSTFWPIKVLMVDFQKKGLELLIKRGSSLFLTRPLISPRP